MQPISIFTLHYQRDSAVLLASIGQLHGATCLDSGLGDHPDARYDIMSAEPAWELRAMRNGEAPHFEHKYIDDPDWQVSSSSNSQALLEILCEQVRQRFQLNNNALSAQIYQTLQHLPFAGGFMGVLGYHFLQDGKTGYRNYADQTEVAVEIGDLKTQPDAWIGWYSWVVIVDHQRQSSCLIIRPECSSQTRDKVLDTLNDWLDPNAETLAATTRPPPDSSSFELQTPFRSLVSQENYLDAFNTLQQWIQEGDCYQTNLAMPFTAEYKGDPLEAYLKLRQLSHSPFSAYVAQFSAGVLSLSPERFIQVNRQTVLTQPIKGTRPRYKDINQDKAAAEALLNSEKDRAENLMIVDLLRNDLGKVCETGSVKVDELFALHSFSQVHHLVSTIRGKLPKNTSALALLLSAFPGGSITGAPKIRAMQIIAELETVPRSAYCGSVFYLDEFNRMDSSITIRTLVCSESRIYCWGGSGVVSDSVGEEEYQECYDKVSALLSGLTLSSAS